MNFGLLFGFNEEELMATLYLQFASSLKHHFFSILIAHIFLSVKPNQTCADLPYLAERHIEKYFICPEGRCLPASGPENATCNYFYDCLNGEDEEGCSKSKKRLDYKFKCRLIVQMKK